MIYYSQYDVSLSIAELTFFPMLLESRALQQRWDAAAGDGRERVAKECIAGMDN